MKLINSFPTDLLLEFFSYLPAKMTPASACCNPNATLLPPASLSSTLDPFHWKLDFFLLNHAAGFPLFLVTFLQAVLNVAVLLASSSSTVTTAMLTSSS